MASIGERIKQRRTEKGLALAELARRTDISKGYLHNIEGGDVQSPSAEILFKIANELGTTIADLLGEEAVDEMQDFEIPDSLKEFAESENLPDVDVMMLAGIQYRGKRPENLEDWRFIYESIKRTLR